jgi:mono/diheme cytochrome c family protein
MDFTRFMFIIMSLSLLSCNKSDDSTAPIVVKPTLTSIQEQIFNVSCASPSCHGSGAGGLELTTGNSFNQLVNVRSQNDGAHNPKFYRVQPNSPDSSFLYIKITNPNTSNQGTLMPRIGGKLSQDKLDAIRTWIANGAQNN